MEKEDDIKKGKEEENMDGKAWRINEDPEDKEKEK